jgi:hypothetical protein
MALPPLDTGAVKATLTWVLPAVAIGFVGALGIMFGVTDAEAAEATEFPNTLEATTVKVYDVPLVNPATTIGELVPETEIFPGEDVTVYPVMALPPLDTDAVKATLACAFPAVAIGLVGALGTE